MEWRVDYFQGVGDVQRVVDTARELNEALGEIPILFTFRTKREGGEKEIGMEDYTALNLSLIHIYAVPGDTVIQPGMFVTMDFGCVWRGYCSDMTRTVAVGKPAPEMERVYQVVLEAQQAGIAAARASPSRSGQSSFSSTCRYSTP